MLLNGICQNYRNIYGNHNESGILCEYLFWDATNTKCHTQLWRVVNVEVAMEELLANNDSIEVVECYDDDDDGDNGISFRYSYMV